MGDESDRHLPAPLVALAGFILPGLGYALIGQKTRGLIAGVAITVLFVFGILIGGIRVIDVPGYYATIDQRTDKKVETWKIRDNFVGELMNRPWYMAQVLTGPMNIVASYFSISMTPEIRQSTARIFDIGTLYTAVAGMLNLLVILDSVGRAAEPKETGAHHG